MIMRTLALTAAAALVACATIASAHADTVDLECHSGRNGRVTTKLTVTEDGRITTKGDAGPVQVASDKPKVMSWMTALRGIDLNAVNKELKRIPKDASYCSLRRGQGKRTQEITFRASQLDRGSARAARISRVFNELLEYKSGK